MDRGNKEERRLRANYVHNAVNGSSVKSGEQISIPVPKTAEGVEHLLESLESYKKTVQQKSIEQLESEIDNEVYDLFNISNKSQDIIENYIQVF